MLCDFGMANVLPQDGNTVSWKLGGTPLYYSPEKANMSFGKAEDVWALGCIILECATGKRVWEVVFPVDQVLTPPWSANQEDPQNPLQFVQRAGPDGAVLAQFERGWGALDAMKKLSKIWSLIFTQLLERVFFPAKE